MTHRIWRLICQGCDRKGPPAETYAHTPRLGIMKAAAAARRAGWTVSVVKDVELPYAPGWCRRCSESIVAGTPS